MKLKCMILIHYVAARLKTQPHVSKMRPQVLSYKLLFQCPNQRKDSKLNFSLNISLYLSLILVF